LASGTVVAPAALLGYIGDADLERYLFAHGTDRVIRASTKRTFTGALRDLIKIRDLRCYHRFCDVPGDRCEIDHIKPWSRGGKTSQENGRLACGFHNRLRNQRPPPPE